MRKAQKLPVSRALAGWKRGASGGGRGASFQVLDLFSGCGGMSLGFAAEGLLSGDFRLLGAVDINASSLETYRHNFGVPAVQYDVRALAQSGQLIEQMLDRLDGYDPDKPLVLIGCAPCQGFSAHRKKNWAQEDLRNNLIEAFAEVANYLKPSCVVMENVPELLSGKYWPYFEAFRDKLAVSGYVTKQAIHNSAEFGTPQERFRAIVIAMPTDNFQLPNSVISREKFITVRDAIGDLPAVKAGECHIGDPFHRSANHRKSTLDVIMEVPKNGGSRPRGIGPACLDKVSGFSDVYGRLSWDKPSITITHYARNPASGRFIHPDQHRGLTIREAARLQGFPDNFELTGTFDDCFRQIGEAVPPPLSVSLAATIAVNLRGEATPESDVDLVQTPINNSFAGVISGLKGKRC